MLKKYLKIYIAIIILLFLISAISVFALGVGDCNPKTGHIVGSDGKDTAQSCYTPLEPNAFAGFNTTSPTGNSLADFLGNVFSFGIAAAVVLALIMIIWGGIEYMTTDSWQNKDDGKKRIQDALLGLGLALISYLILFTINPCLVDFMGNKGCNTTNTFLTTPTTK